MNERRKGQHKAVHRLAQVYADLTLAEKEVNKLELPSEFDRGEYEKFYAYRHRALCLVRESMSVIGHVVDKDLGPKLVEAK